MSNSKSSKKQRAKRAAQPKVHDVIAKATEMEARYRSRITAQIDTINRLFAAGDGATYDNEMAALHSHIAAYRIFATSIMEVLDHPMTGSLMIIKLRKAAEQLDRDYKRPVEPVGEDVELPDVEPEPHSSTPGKFGPPLPPQPEPKGEGWGLPAMARKAHYFVNGEALCGKWLYAGELVPDNEAELGPDDCVACGRQLKKIAP